MIYYERNSNPKYYEEHCCDANCGSYALNLQGWYDPEEYFCSVFEVEYPEDMLLTMLEDGYDEDEINRIYADVLVEGMLIEFNNELRQLTSMTDKIEKDEELISFRTFTHQEDISFIHYDFHFKVFRDGVWMEKNGPQEVHQCGENDWREYDSRTYYFAHKIILEEGVA